MKACKLKKGPEQTLPTLPIFDSPAKYLNIQTVENFLCYKDVQIYSCANFHICKYLQMWAVVGARKLEEEGVLAQRQLCCCCYASFALCQEKANVVSHPTQI